MPRKRTLIPSPLAWTATPAPVAHPMLPVVAERGGTQLRTPLPVAIVDTREQNPLSFRRFKGWFAKIEHRALKLGLPRTLRRTISRKRLSITRKTKGNAPSKRRKGLPRMIARAVGGVAAGAAAVAVAAKVRREKLHRPTRKLWPRKLRPKSRIRRKSPLPTRAAGGAAAVEVLGPKPLRLRWIPTTRQ